MNDPLTRILLLLAAADFQDADVHELVARLHHMDQSEVMARYRSMRKELRETVRRSELHPSHSPRPSQHADANIVLRVDRLLRREAGLTVSEAAGRLIDRLEHTSAIAPGSMPLPRRESFLRWLDRLAHHVSGTQLLHHASQIRNEQHHGRPSDWHLRSREDAP